MAAAVENNSEKSYDESKEIIKQVRVFVRGSTHGVKVPSDELMKAALFLLRTLPPAQDAVLEHLSNIFDDMINAYILNVELGKDPANDESSSALIQEVVGVLLGLVKNNPDIWAPLVSNWAVDLLGRVSSKYSDRRALPRTANLTEVLQLWMSCQPTQALIEITSECFSSMVDRTPDISVDALLRASASHSPHFDWVVAHIGSCFPCSIINRVLLLGLKDYHQNTQAHSGSQTEPKMSSVVGILSHLTVQHSNDMNISLTDLFNRSLSAEASAEEQCTIPFLLHLASLSPVLLHAMSLHALKSLKPEVLHSIALQFKQNKYLVSQKKENLIQLVVHLLMKIEEAARPVILFLLDTASPVLCPSAEADPNVVSTCSTILNHLFLEIQHVVHSKSSDSSAGVPLLKSLSPHVSSLCRLVAESSGNRCLWLSRLLALTAAHCHENITTEILHQIVTLANTAEQLSIFSKVQSEAELRHPHVTSCFVSRVMSQLSGLTSRGQGVRVMQNLLTLVKWEQNEKPSYARSLCHKLGEHLSDLNFWLQSEDFNCASVAMELIHNAAIPHQADMATLLKTCSAVMVFFFSSMKQKDGKKQSRCIDMSISYMTKLCCHGNCQKILLRKLLEGSIAKNNKVLFGSKINPSSVKSLPKQNESLMKSNSALSRPKGGAVVHTGVIGSGLRSVSLGSTLPKEQEEFNKQKLTEALAKCACYHGNSLSSHNSMETDDVAGNQWSISSDTAKYLALQFIELVTPDVMYNGIPWPEEDFMKVTVERDLQIKAVFLENPILWDIMDLLSEGPGAMCYCSVILRCILATIIAHYEGSRENLAKESSWQLSAACRIIEYMRKGQLIPSPLHHTVEILPHLSPFNAFLLLINLWKYVKENPPVPISRMNVEIKCLPKYTDHIRFILHDHIAQLGKFYPLFFGASKS